MTCAVCAMQNTSIFRIISTENILKEEPTFSTRPNVLVPFENSFSKQGMQNSYPTFKSK